MTAPLSRIRLPAFRLPALLRLARVTALCLPLCACGTMQSVGGWFKGSDEPRAAANTQPPTTAVAVSKDSYHQQFGWVHTEPSEAGGVSELPVTLDVDRVKTALGELKGTGGGFKNDPLFTKREIEDLAQPLVDALAQGKPNQDVTFAVTGKHTDLGLFETEAATAGRVFVEKGRLQVIFGMTRFNFGDELRGEGMLRPFIPGQRAAARSQPTPVLGRSWQAVAGRPDWMSIDIRVLEPGPGMQPAGALAPASAPLPAATAPAAAPLDATSAERRLTTLQRLRDKGLISEQEFQDRRKAILDGL